jgi:leader peptidase (prepilin peptidase)/N-methyltransferase
MTANLIAAAGGSRFVGLAAGLGLAVGVGGALIAERSAVAIAVTGGFCAVLAAVSVADLRERRIPNAWTYPALLGALATAAATGNLLPALGGFGLAGGFFAVMFVVGRGRLGMGDVKLGALAGVVLGAAAAPMFVFVGTAAGALAAALLLLRGTDRRATFAYGPSLAAGAALVVLLRGPVIS